MDNFIFNINLEKYKLLKQINPDYLNEFVDNIFEIGYSNYIKNLIKSELNNTNDIQNIVTENKLSSIKGGVGENIVYDILIDKFNDFVIENTSKIPHSGDIQIILPSQKKIIVEVKNYNKTIDIEQIDKLKFDMKFTKINYAMFISLNSGIVGKKKFEIEVFPFGKENYYIIYVPYSMHKSIPNRKYIITHNSIEDSINNLTIKLEFGICILQNISEKFNKLNFNNKYFINSNIDYLIIELNNFYEEFRTIKNSSFKLEENIKKNLESHLNIIKEYEHSIKNKINHLIKKKLNNNLIDKKLNIKIYKNNNQNWDILINDIIYGKIIYINNIYDLLINYDNLLIHEEFNSYQECLNYIEIF